MLVVCLYYNVAAHTGCPMTCTTHKVEREKGIFLLRDIVNAAVFEKKVYKMINNTICTRKVGAATLRD